MAAVFQPTAGQVHLSIVPAKGSKKKGDWWTTTHIDHSVLLQFIHLQTQAGIKLDVDEFLKTPQGKRPESKRGDKKIKCHFPNVTERHKDWKESGGGAGKMFLIFDFDTCIF